MTTTRIMIVYDSENGHTERLARSIAEGAHLEHTEVLLKHVNEIAM